MRKVRATLYDLPDKGIDPSRFVLTEKSQSSFELPESHAPAETSLPAIESDAVVIGEVTDAHAYLSNDRTSVYSEFELRI